MDPIASTVAIALAVAVVGLLFWLRLRARREEARAKARLKRAEEEGALLPPSLHPVIDPQICIGSLSCISACPEGDILGIVDGAARLVQGSSCIGHGRCAMDCPVDAIRLVFGSSERGVDLPEVDASFESSRPGVFIVGELGGMGLIKNAMIQGLQAGANLAKQLRGAPTTDILDAVIVGAGPAGIATAAALERVGLRYEVLERDAPGGAIRSYPRQKVVMTEKIQLPGWGSFGRRRMSKEALVEGLAAIVERLSLKVRSGVSVEGIRGHDGAFVVDTTAGEYRARKVVLAIGRRGTPRRLGVPGEEQAKVTYALMDPTQYAGRRVLVVGGGDSAVEAAVSLAEAGAITSISYRKPSFARCRAPNRAALDRAVSAGTLQTLTPSEVERIDEDRVVLSGPSGRVELANDFVLVCAGGELPVAFLTRCSVGLKRHQGDQAMPSPAARPAREKGEYVRRDAAQERARTRRLNWALAFLGAATVLVLAGLGWDYYWLAEDARFDSPMHEAWRPAGDVGHGIGVIASLVMLSNFLYPLRKRLGFLKGTAPINRWLTFHVFVGLLSPAVIAFHAAFQSNNLIATGTFLSLLVVVGTGLVGRFVYGLIPRAEGRVVARDVLEEQVRMLFERAGSRLARIRDPQALERSLAALTPHPERRSTVAGLFVRYPAAWIVEQVTLLRHRRDFERPEDYRDFADTSRLLFRLKFQLELYEALRRFLGWWRALHVTLALLLVVIMGSHIGVAVYLGYGWILF